MSEHEFNIPEGFALVPVKSTDFQRVCVRDYYPDICDYEWMTKNDWEQLFGRVYERMIEAYQDES